MENEKHTLEDLKNNKITEKREKWDMHSIGTGIWWENWKSLKMRITLLGSEIWREILKNMKNDECTL